MGQGRRDRRRGRGIDWDAPVRPSRRERETAPGRE